MPSYEKIAEDTGLGRRAVIIHCKSLKDDGWLLLLPRANGRGSQSNIYQLLDPRLWKTPDRSDQVVHEVHQVVHEVHPLGGAPGAPRSVRPNEGLPEQPSAPVDNPAATALIAGMVRQHTSPTRQWKSA